MDGLLLNTEQLFMDKKAIFLKKYGYPARKEDYVKTLGTAGEQLKKIQQKIYGVDYPADTITQETRAEVHKHLERYGPEIKPGISELLKFFRENNVCCCVASSTETKSVEKYLKLADIAQYFEFVIGGDMVTHSKPHPEIFLEAFTRKHLQKSEALIFEDSENGLRAAKAAEIPVICIPDLKYPDESLQNIPLCILSSAFEVIDLFRF